MEVVRVTKVKCSEKYKSCKYHKDGICIADEIEIISMPTINVEETDGINNMEYIPTCTIGYRECVEYMKH